MKHLINLLLLCLAIPAAAQYSIRTIENTYELPAGKRVDLNLKFAEMVMVGTWEGAGINLKTIIKRSDPDMDEIHQMTVQRTGDALRIETDYKMDESVWQDYRCWSCDESSAEKNCICFSVSYEIQLPADADLRLETISGDLEINGLRGPLRAKSISGFVDVSLSPRAASDLRFKSVTGEIYTDFDIQLDENSTAYSKRLNTRLNGGGPLISLETVSGDIFFRKI
jgi:hypothetical protein